MKIEEMKLPKLFDPFIMLLLGAITLAYLCNYTGIDVSGWRLAQIGSAGIGGIFFLYGLKLDMHQMKSGLYNWRVHLAVQVSTFVLFPLLVLPGYIFWGQGEYLPMWLAVYFLACLPSTVSSSVVMVSIAGGNIPSAIFNASISGIIGIVATPLLMQPFIAGSGASPQFADVALGLLYQVLLPVAGGMLLRPVWGAWIDMHKKMLSNFDKSVILLIVFESFAHSFTQQIFADIALPVFVTICTVSISLFFAVYEILHFLASQMRLAPTDATVLLFCGSKKSLVHGTVFASLLFAGAPGAGLFLIPIMLYHAFQLIAVSLLAQKRQKSASIDKNIN